MREKDVIELIKREIGMHVDLNHQPNIQYGTKTIHHPMFGAISSPVCFSEKEAIIAILDKLGLELKRVSSIPEKVVTVDQAPPKK